MTIKKHILPLLLALMLCLSLLPVSASAASNAANGDWAAKTVALKNTAEAELMVRVGDIDALNDADAVEYNGYDPFTAADQYAHGYPWAKDETDPMGTDRIYVGSRWNGETTDGYSASYCGKNDDPDNAYGDGALEITMSYDAAGITVKNALLQLCIDDFQAISWESSFTVKLNGKDAPFIAELLNHVDQTGPTAYIVSAILPASFLADVSSGRLVITVDETTGCGDGFAIDFAKLLINYKNDVFKGNFTGTSEPGATVRLLGTSTTVKVPANGRFEFEAIPGLNAIRASKDGYVEGYDFGIVVAQGAATSGEDERWTAAVNLEQGQGNPDIDFSQFGVTAAWENAHAWAVDELNAAAALGLIPDCLNGADLTKPITRAEFAAVSVKVYESLTGTKAEPIAVNPFKDTNDVEVLKALGVGVTNGTGDGTTFSPNVLLNREQAATMLTRVYKKVLFDGWTLETDGSFAGQFKALFTAPAPFADDTNISGWAKDSVYFMAANGIINGVGDNKFAPKAVTESEKAMGYAQATREQALLIAARMVKNLGE